ncbi:DUF3120 domain-containing protein [Synechococcus elongatus]|uniref:DUF3120 domain-containing protein n=1 Tax=Synechococcus elongatus PCC 11801 TaxID=2219813 RepID=A0AAN1QPJ0_SYNEL|nr:DUF3120 domain-containing protein [Synechococcus elongatus]
MVVTSRPTADTLVRLLSRDMALSTPRPWVKLWAAAFLVSVPVFVQAPLVRLCPEASLLISLIWFAIAGLLQRQPRWQSWGDLLQGFAWSWLAGSIYWGWLRWEPYLHLPVEAIALPLVIVGLRRQQGLVGHGFYLGSLIGTAVTDGYFYWIGAVPFWREIARSSPTEALPLAQQAIACLQSPTALVGAIVLIPLLCGAGVWALRQPRPAHWAFAGAVLGTLLVDALFGLVAVSDRLSLTQL